VEEHRGPETGRKGAGEMGKIKQHCAIFRDRKAGINKYWTGLNPPPPPPQKTPLPPKTSPFFSGGGKKLF